MSQITDSNNKSFFFFCDVKKSGVSFILRHMRCGPGRVFEASWNACVLKGTTRKIRNYEDSGNFTCAMRKPGKYPDENCHIYHLCLQQDLFSPFEHLVVKCPRSTAYDDQTKKCTKSAGKLCNSQSSKISCTEEIRFRETRNCEQYFLCYQDQVEKFSCPLGYAFDERKQRCEPENFVSCD